MTFKVDAVAAAIDGCNNTIESYKDFIEYELGIDSSFIGHADEALVAVANACEGDNKDFIENLRKFMCVGADGADQFFSNPNFYDNLNKALQSASSISGLIEPELIFFLKSGIKNFVNVSRFLTPELQDALIEAIDTVSKLGTMTEVFKKATSIVNSFTSEHSALMFGVGAPMAARVLIAYIKYSLDTEGKEFLRIMTLKTMVTSSQVTSILKLQMQSVINATHKTPKSETECVRKIIEQRRKESLKILEDTENFADNFIRYLKHTRHVHAEYQMKYLSDIEKLNYHGNGTNAGMLLNLIYSGQLKKSRVKPSNINYNVILEKAKNNKTLSQKCDNLQEKMKNHMHNLYWAVLRDVSTPKDLISLLMKDAYYQRKGSMDELKSPEGIECTAIEKAYKDFNILLKKDYHDFLNERWHKNEILNRIYGEALFLRSFLAFNLNMSYKLANYSLPYAARQAYLGFEDVGRALLHPITTVQNLLFLGCELLLHPIQTITNIVKAIGRSIWNQPTRALTKLIGDLLLTGGAEALVSSVGLKLTSVSAPVSMIPASSKLTQMMQTARVGMGANSAAVIATRAATVTAMFTSLSSAHKRFLPRLDSSPIAGVKEAFETNEKCVKQDLSSKQDTTNLSISQSCAVARKNVVIQNKNSTTCSAGMLLRSGRLK